MPISFDSILVRLKGTHAPFRHVFNLFRFHTGSIKSARADEGIEAMIQFRFHTGSIKSQKCNSKTVALSGFDSILVRLKEKNKRSGVSSRNLSFDSILVRLKEWLILAVLYTQSWFRFHTGSIKSSSTNSTFIPSACFDSILVRLKGCDASKHRLNLDSFDSILVRLKGYRQTEQTSRN